MTTQTFSQELGHNAEVAFKSGSTYVVLVLGALATLFAALTTTQQDALLASFPFLKGYTPIVAAVAAFLVTKLKPSGSFSTQTQALIDEIARLRLNMTLKAAGQAEIPAPPAAATLPIPVPVPPAPPAAARPAPVLPPAPPPYVAPVEVRFAPLPEPHQPAPTWVETRPFEVAPSPPPSPPPSLVDPMFTIIKAMEATVPDDVIAGVVKTIRSAKRLPSGTDIPLP